MISLMKKLFIGIKGHVVCLDKKTGNELWRTKIRSSAITNVIFDGDALYAYCNGHLFSLDPNTGDQLWENQLNGLGYGYCIIASEDTKVDQQTINAAQYQHAAASVNSRNNAANS